MQGIIGGGSYAGASGGFSVNLEVTNADTVEQLRGFGLQTGGSAGDGLFVEGGAIAGPDYAGSYIGLGLGGGATPVAGYIYNTYTAPFNTSASMLNGQSGCSSKCY